MKPLTSLLLCAISVCVSLACFIPLSALAQSVTGETGNQFISDKVNQRTNEGVGDTGAAVKIDNPLEAENITDFFLELIQIILIFAVPIIVFFIILSGFNMVTAQGDTTKLQTAKRAFLYAIIGALLILGAYVILEVIQNTVNSFTA